MVVDVEIQSSNLGSPWELFREERNGVRAMEGVFLEESQIWTNFLRELVSLFLSLKLYDIKGEGSWHVDIRGL